MEDSQIVELFWKREQTAIEESEKKYGKYCFSVAKNILEDQEDSEECVNDTWMQAWKSMPPHRPEVLRMFFAKITRALSWNRYRAEHAQKRGGGQVALVLEELEECVAGGGSPEEAVLAKELGELIREFVLGLPEKDRYVFARRYFFTESIAEIADDYGMTENHVTVTLSRARKKLREALTGRGYM